MTINQHQIINRIFLYLISLVEWNQYCVRVIKFISNDPLYKGVIILGSGTAVAQLIGIITSPIITRLYTPSDLGILAVYSSVLAIASTIATLRYEFAYALPKQDKDVANLFGLCLVLLFLSTAGFALILLFGGESLTDAFNLNSITEYTWFLLIGFFGMGFYNILNYWGIRQRDYKRITYTRINQGVGGALCKIILGILSFGPLGLIIGQIVSQIAGIGTLAYAMWDVDRQNLKMVSLTGIKYVAKKYKSFPIFNLPASIVNTISLQIPSLMLLALYDAKIVGFYALAQMLLVLPSSVISYSMGQAYLGEASRMVREESHELRSLYVRALRRMFMVATPLIGIPALCAPFVVPFIFGEAWAEAGWYCWPLALMVISNFVVSPISWLEIYNCNHWVLIWDAIRAIAVLSAFYISSFLELSPKATILLYSSIMCSMYILYILINLHAIRRFYITVRAPPS